MISETIKQVQTIESLDDKWIKNFEEEDEPYEDFYKEDNYYINIDFLYIDYENNLEKIKQEKFFMNTPNYIMREEMIYLLKKNTIMNNKRYSLFSLLKYHMTLDPQEITNYLSKEKDPFLFLHSIKNLDTLFFEKTISSFQDINSLIFLLREKPSINNNINTNITSIPRKQTKKIYWNCSYSGKKRGTRRA
jgi:hypothetical protein